MRLAYYAGASTAAAAACLIKAFHERPNFYSATVYLSQSNACVLILTNLLLICAFGSIYALQRLLYGRLRPIEVEQLSEKAWYAVLDTLLAMPSFREDVGGWLLTMFVLLLAGKVWGWIGEGRVDVLEQQPPANPRLFHTRLATSLLVSVGFDMWMTYYCFDAVVANPKPGMMVIFTFEFAILTIFSSFTFLRYTLSVISAIITQRQTLQAIEIRKSEIRAERHAAAAAREGDDQGQETPNAEEPIEVDENEVDVPGWEEKRRWLFGLEVFTDFLKLLLYVVFFTVSITFNGLPMHIMRDVYMTAASFSKRITDYVNYKKATSDMNARYPDATTEEIRGDACIVCREDMIAWSEGEPAGEQGAPRQRRDEGQRAKKLPCNHILHLRCLKAWLERQQVCPTCRRPVVSAPRPVPISAAVAQAAGNAQAGAAPVVPPAANNNAAQQAHAPAPAARQPQAPAQAQAQAPVVRQPPAMNRARFFNLGPLRIGFLNGPVGQIDNLVENLRNGQQAPAQQPQPQNVPPPTNSGRVSQNEISDMGNRLMQEASLLNIERAQLENLRLMRHELDRLRHLHSTQQNQNQQAGLHPVTHLVPPVTHLSGNHSQQIPAGSNELPQGLVLPDGWTLTPLRRQQPFNQHGVVPQSVHNATPTPTSQMPGHATTQAQTSMSARSETSSAPPGPSNAANEIGPVDESGSPLFVPRAHEAEQIPSTTLPDAVRKTGEAEENKETVPRDAANAPWSSSDWNFDSQGKTESAQDTFAAGEPSTESSDKGKGKAVQIEDAPNSES